MGLLSTRKEYPKVKKLPKEGFGLTGKDLSNQQANQFSEKSIIGKTSVSVFTFITKHLDVTENTNFLTATATRFNIDKLPQHTYNNIVNLKKINDSRYVNKFFESINTKLDKGGLYINCVEAYNTRRRRVLKKYIRPFNWFYYTADVVFMRVFPKLLIAKNIYFFITKGRNRVLTRAETFGRLYSCGFEIIDEEIIDNKLYFVARKIKEPVFDSNPSYGLIVRLKRIGKGGTIFNVYKLRTMYAYSEYLQEYVHKHNSLKENGKFKNDFRITTEGKFFRKFWLDELPMLINLLKGNMKLVGVRPLSTHYFSLYTKELQEKRILHKPGLVPPYYADMPKNLDEIIASEMRYLEAYEKHPFRTDVKYFFKVFYNIFFKGARSS
ncbi:sugar transferase [Flavobacteriaceae bacterium PRS1]|nr:sugar transferase [Flavobacteriaceae bacterium PRS1]